MTAIAIRRARPAECDAVAERVRRLGVDIGSEKVPKIAGATLAAEIVRPDPLVHVWIAETASDALAGILIGVVTLSTWRGCRGLYVCDLWIDGAARGRRLGEALLAEAAREAQRQGWGFLKLEVAADNDGAARFYRRLGFDHAETETLWVLEATALARLADG